MGEAEGEEERDGGDAFLTHKTDMSSLDRRGEMIWSRPIVVQDALKRSEVSKEHGRRPLKDLG